MYVCLCKAVSDHAISGLIDAGARTVEEISNRSGAGTKCGNCLDLVEEIVAAAVARQVPPAPEAWQDRPA